MSTFKKLLATFPAALVIVFTIHAVINIIWAIQDNAFASFPHYYHYDGIDLLENYLKHNWGQIFTTFDYSVIHHLFAITSLITGLNHISFAIPSTICLGILMLTIWKLCHQHFSMTNKASQLASIILSLYPAVFGYSRCYHFMIGLLALLAINTLLMFNFYKKPNVKTYFLWILTLILGLKLEPTSTETEAIIFLVGIAPPLLWITVKSILEIKSLPQKNYFRTLSVYLAIPAGGVMTLIIMIMLKSLQGMDYLQYILTEHTIYCSAYDVYNIKKYFVNIYMLFSEQMGIMWGIILSASLLIIKKRTKQYLIMLLWLSIPLIITAFFDKKNSLYSTPVLIPAAIISAQYLSQLRNKTLNTCVIFGILSIAFTQYWILSFSPKNNFYRRCLLLPHNFASKLVQSAVPYAEPPYQYTKIEKQFIDKALIILKKSPSPVHFLCILTNSGVGQSYIHKIAVPIYLEWQKISNYHPYFFASMEHNEPVYNKHRNMQTQYWIVEQEAYDRMDSQRQSKLGIKKLHLRDGQQGYLLFCPIPQKQPDLHANK